eukprot:jgi/Pico_ML_1/55873/g1494.t2
MMASTLSASTSTFAGKRVVQQNGSARVAVARNMPVVEAAVKLRFKRFGRKKLPFYRIVAMDSRDKRDGRALEELGWYDPIRHETQLKAPEIKRWLDVGAEPTKTVENLLKKAMIINP